MQKIDIDSDNRATYVLAWSEKIYKTVVSVLGDKAIFIQALDSRYINLHERTNDGFIVSDTDDTRKRYLPEYGIYIVVPEYIIDMFDDTISIYIVCRRRDVIFEQFYCD